MSFQSGVANARSKFARTVFNAATYAHDRSFKTAVRAGLSSIHRLQPALRVLISLVGIGSGLIVVFGAPGARFMSSDPPNALTNFATLCFHPEHVQTA